MNTITTLKSTLFLLAMSATLAEASVDYEAARALSKKTTGKVLNTTITPIWSPDASALYYRSGSEIFLVDTATGKKTKARISGKFASFFSGATPKIERFSISEDNDFICLATDGKAFHTLRVARNDVERIEKENNPFILPARKVGPHTRSGRIRGASKIFFINDTEETLDIEWISDSKSRRTYATLKPGESHIQSTHAGHVFAAGQLAFSATKQSGIAYLSSKPETPKEPEPEPEPETEMSWKPQFRQHNLFVTNRTTGKEVQLTENGTKEQAYSGPLLWSPCGRYLVAMREKAGTKRRIDLIKAAPSNQLQPVTESIPYLKPGDDLDVKKPHLFHLETGKEIALDDSLYSNPWNLTRPHWTPDGEQLFVVYNERGHQTMRLLSIESSTGKVESIIEETSPTFIDYSRKTDIHHLDDTDEVVWMSERSGWNHLYLVDRKTGKISPITSGKWVVRGVDYIDKENRQIWFRAGGIHPGQDPYYIHYARINFDGSGLVILTEENGTHATQFSEDRRFFIDTWSRVDQPPIHELRRSSDGKKVALLDKADASELLEVHPHLPEPFTAKGRDGKTDIYGMIIRPSHFDPNKKYPVIESIYAGPHDQHVPKTFSTYRGQQRLAELGFIVVRIDGMGTNWRSKEFHDVCWKNIKDAGFPDRIAWMQAAAEKYPSMDLSRVGIYGGSAGGQNAVRAVLDHADFYKAAAADCGCHDNRMDKIWWNEAWMGWPVGESYEQSSNVTDAHKLGGKLLLTVGMMDRNVDPSSTMQVVEALIKADKDFEFLPFPTLGHGAGGSPYGQRRREEFFVRHLIEETP